ncbi:DedA family protein [Endozoicomonadaceae bacterium StTr2]
MLESLLALSSHPAWMAVAIILGTYILEDLAIVSAALLCADGMLSPWVGYAALVFGIYTGDLGLYGLGKLFHQWQPRFFREKLKRPMNRLEPRLRAHMVSVVLLVRVIPGLRLPSYLGCGYFRLSFQIFNGLVLLASSIWTAAVFWLIYFLGVEFWHSSGEARWLLPIGFIVLVLGLHRLLGKVLSRYMDIKG